MDVRVRAAAGDGFDLLLAATAVADSDWRGVFTHGPRAYDDARDAGGHGLVRDAARLGRFGWINLVSVVASQRAPWSVPKLLGAVTAMSPEELHAVVMGGRRRALLDLVGLEGVTSAAAGDRVARSRVRAAASSEGTLLAIAPWLLRASSREVSETCLRVLRALPPPTGSPDTAVVEQRLGEVGGAALIEQVAPGVSYGPAALDRVLLVTSRQVSPILVVIDEPRRTIVIHPPLGRTRASDAPGALLALGRAVGDATRMRLLHEIRRGPRRLTELCSALGSPRTTLLHHLALLRAAGLIEIAVPAGEPNVYSLRAEGFELLARLAREFARPELVVEKSRHPC